MVFKLKIIKKELQASEFCEAHKILSISAKNFISFFLCKDTIKKLARMINKISNIIFKKFVFTLSAHALSVLFQLD